MVHDTSTKRGLIAMVIQAHNAEYLDQWEAMVEILHILELNIPE